MSAWPRARLGDCAEIISGSTPKTSVGDFWDGDVNWATPKDLSDLDGHVITSTARTITAAGLRSCGASVLPSGSVLFSSRAPIGLVAVNTVPMATNQGFKSLIPRPDLLDSGYLAHWLRTNRKHLDSLGNGATFKEVSKAVVSRVEIPLPPVSEQRRIAEVLDRADALRTKRRRTLALLDGLTQSIFHDMFGDPQENSAGFDLRPLNEWLPPDRPMTYGILMPGPDTPGGVPYVRVVDMREGGVAVAGVKRTTPEMSQQYKRSLLSSGDLLMSIRGHVGRLALIPDELEGANITQDSARLSVSAKSRHYVLEALRTPAMQRWMAKRIKGVAVQGINLGDLRKLPLPVPPLELQAAFAQQCEAQARARRAQATSVNLVEDLFGSLQQRAFAGEL